MDRGNIISQSILWILEHDCILPRMFGVDRPIVELRMHWCDIDTYCNANSTCEPLFISPSSPMSIQTYNQHSHQHSQTNSLTDPQRVSSRGKWCKRTIYSTLHKTYNHLYNNTKSCSCQFQLYDDTIYCEAMSAIHDLRTHFDNYGASMDFHFLVASCEDCRLLPFWGAWLAKKWHWFTSFVDIYHCLHRSTPINYIYSISSFVDLFCINCM